MRQFVSFIKHRQPAAIVWDSRGNASAATGRSSRYEVARRKVLRACMTIWKFYVKLKARLQHAFEKWADETPALLIKSRTLLCYAPIAEPGQEVHVSSMEEID